MKKRKKSRPVKKSWKRRKLTKKDKRTLDKFYKAMRSRSAETKRAERVSEGDEPRGRSVADKLARRLARVARIRKHELIKSSRPTVNAKKRATIARKTSLNTWIEEQASTYSKIEFIEVNENSYINRRTGKAVKRSTVSRAKAGVKYWQYVHFLQEVLGTEHKKSSVKEARRAYRALKDAAILESLGLEAEYE